MDRFTIIPADGLVIIDGDARGPLQFDIGQEVHAVQWYGEFGEVEFRPVFNGTQVVKPANQVITDYEQFRPALVAWESWQPAVTLQGMTTPPQS